jgi:mono/diheme cytochrome c family protein
MGLGLLVEFTHNHTMDILRVRQATVPSTSHIVAPAPGSPNGWAAWFMIFMAGCSKRSATRPVAETRRQCEMAIGLFSERRARLGVLTLVTAGAIIAANLIGFADTAKPMSAKAKQGAALFQENCVSCHNKQPDDTTPFGPPNLHGIFSSKPMVKPPITPAQASDIIRKGVAPMPAFGELLTEAQINDLIAYLKVQ